MLDILEHLPDGLLELEARALQSALKGPTLIHLPGRRPEPLFVSVLLHGNEDTGWQAARQVLRRHREHPLPRALSLFIGNVAAAGAGLRRLDGQVDYNRVWPGSPEAHLPEQAMMRRVVEEMRQRQVFAAVDVHNNTGLNPHYACVNRLEPAFFQLATLFSRTVVYFLRPLGVQSAAFAPHCPAVTVECGKPGAVYGETHAADFIEACLNLSEFPVHAVAPQDIDLYHTVATVRVPDSVSFAFADQGADIELLPDIDHLNFRELEPGSVLGRVRHLRERYLDVSDEEGRDVSQHMFDCSDGQIRLRRRLMPAMLTRDDKVIRQDCLCYLMERLPYPVGGR